MITYVRNNDGTVTKKTVTGPLRITQHPVRCLRCAALFSVLGPGEDRGTGPAGHHGVHAKPTVCGSCAAKGERL